MKRKNIVGIAAAGFLLFTGCSGNRQETTEYDWIPPVEGVSWGQEKEEVLQAIGVSEEDTEVLGGEAEGTVEMVILQEPLSFLGEKAQATLSFEPGGGLVSITFAFEKDDVITELIPRIKEAYPSETGGTSTSIYGSVPEQMEEALCMERNQSGYVGKCHGAGVLKKGSRMTETESKRNKYTASRKPYGR